MVSCETFNYCESYIHGDQNVSVHLIITVQEHAKIF
jgi:hypothetical protein